MGFMFARVQSYYQRAIDITALRIHTHIREASNWGPLVFSRGTLGNFIINTVKSINII